MSPFLCFLVWQVMSQWRRHLLLDISTFTIWIYFHHHHLLHQTHRLASIYCWAQWVTWITIKSSLGVCVTLLCLSVSALPLITSIIILCVSGRKYLYRLSSHGSVDGSSSTFVCRPRFLCPMYIEPVIIITSTAFSLCTQLQCEYVKKVTYVEWSTQPQDWALSLSLFCSFFLSLHHGKKIIIRVPILGQMERQRWPMYPLNDSPLVHYIILFNDKRER